MTETKEPFSTDIMGSDGQHKTMYLVFAVATFIFALLAFILALVSLTRSVGTGDGNGLVNVNFGGMYNLVQFNQEDQLLLSIIMPFYFHYDTEAGYQLGYI